MLSETTTRTDHERNELAKDDALVAEIVVRPVRGRVCLIVQYWLGLAETGSRDRKYPARNP